MYFGVFVFWFVGVFFQVEVYFLEDTNAPVSPPPGSVLIHISSVVGLRSIHGHLLLAAGPCREGSPFPLMTNGREKERCFLELHPRESNRARAPGRASAAMEISAFKEQKSDLRRGRRGCAGAEVLLMPRAVLQTPAALQ